MEVVRDLMIVIVTGSREIAAGNFYGEGEAVAALKRTQRILDNYNRNLANSRLEKEIKALRMLQEENEGGTLTKEKLILAADSRDYLSDHYPTFNPYNAGDRVISTDQPPGGDMLVHPGDIRFYSKYTNQKVIIDLDKKTIHFEWLFYLEEIDKWEINNEDSISNLNFWDEDFVEIPFNQLTELSQFVEENERGFLSNTYMGVLMPIKTEEIENCNDDPDASRDFF